MSIWIPDGPTWPTKYLVPAPWNPNKQNDRVFKNLVDAIRQVGFLEPVVIAPVPEDNWQDYLTEDQYAEGIERFRLIVGGKHRWDAANVLDMPEVPIVFKEDFDEDLVKLQNMRLNMLRGKIDPAKFQSLFMDLVEKGYSDELLREQMGLVEEQAFQSLVKDIKEDLPPELRKKVESAEEAGDIETVDDLQRLLNELLSKHGDTLPYDYLIFDYSGKSVVWVQLDEDAHKEVTQAVQRCFDARVSVNRLFHHLLASEHLEGALESAMTEAEEEEDLFD